MFESGSVSQSVVSNSLRPHGLQDASLPCPSLSYGVCSNSCPLSQWCHPNISSFVAPFSSSPYSFAASRSFLWVRWPKYYSFNFSISPSSEYLGLISLQSKGLSRVFSNTIVQKHQFFGAQPSLWSNSHICTWLPEKPSVQLVQSLSRVRLFVTPWIAARQASLSIWLYGPL